MPESESLIPTENSQVNFKPSYWDPKSLSVLVFFYATLMLGGVTLLVILRPNLGYEFYGPFAVLSGLLLLFAWAHLEKSKSGNVGFSISNPAGDMSVKLPQWGEASLPKFKIDVTKATAVFLLGCLPLLAWAYFMKKIAGEAPFIRHVQTEITKGETLDSLGPYKSRLKELRRELINNYGVLGPTAAESRRNEIAVLEESLMLVDDKDFNSAGSKLDSLSLSYADTFILRARVKYALGLIDQAESDYQRIFFGNQGNSVSKSEALNGLVAIEQLRGKIEPCRQELDKSIEWLGNRKDEYSRVVFVEALLTRAKSRFDSDNLQGAIADWRIALDVHSEELRFCEYFEDQFAVIVEYGDEFVSHLENPATNPEAEMISKLIENALTQFELQIRSSHTKSDIRHVMHIVALHAYKSGNPYKTEVTLEQLTRTIDLADLPEYQKENLRRAVAEPILMDIPALFAESERHERTKDFKLADESREKAIKLATALVSNHLLSDEEAALIATLAFSADCAHTIKLIERNSISEEVKEKVHTCTKILAPVRYQSKRILTILDDCSQLLQSTLKNVSTDSSKELLNKLENEIQSVKAKLVKLPQLNYVRAF